MKTGTYDARKRISFQTALVFLFLLYVVVGNAWSDDIILNAKTRQVVNVTSSSVMLQGTVYSNSPISDTFYAFQWGTTTSYENQTSTQNSGASPDRPEVDVSGELTNLIPNTTYHYRLVVWNSEGKVYGEEKTFITYIPPTATTDTATNVTYTTATLIGTVNPNGMKTFVTFYYGPGSGEVNTAKQDAGNGTSPLRVSAGISNLQPGTTYFYRIEASSAGGTVSGPQMSFTTPTLAPIVTTDDATNVANQTAILNGTINPQGTNVTYYFQWGPNENPTAYKTYLQSVGSGNTPINVSAALRGLKPGVTYHYTIFVDYNFRISGAEGRGQTNGEYKTFTTLMSPGAATNQATNITSNSATLNGIIAPNGLPTVWYFEYRKYLFARKRTGIMGEPITQNLNASVNITGLDPNSTYRFRIVAKNNGGMAYGPERMFKTLPVFLPVATTGRAYTITANSATLEGVINPRGSLSSYRFQYGPTTSYGNYSPGKTRIIGTDNVSVSDTIKGLNPNTKYHYRLVASSAKGPVCGVDKTFTTLFAKPIVRAGTVTKVAAAPKPVVTASIARKVAAAPKPAVTVGTAAKVAAAPKPAVTASIARKVTSAPKPTVTAGTAAKVAAAPKPAVTTSIAKKVTSAPKPTVTTGMAKNITATRVTITGTVNPNGLGTTYYFEYGPTISYGNTVPASPRSAGNGTSNINVSADIGGTFAPKSTHHYRIVATNKSGTTYGEDKVFIIPSTLLPVMKKISPAPVSKSVTGAQP